MLGKIDQVKDAQSGKTLSVLVQDQWYSTKIFELRNMVGQTLELQVSSSPWQGKVMHWINDYSTVPPTADDAMNAAMAPTPPAQAYEAPMGMPQNIPLGQPPTVNREGSIVAQALTKACTGPGEPVTDVWTKYITLYQSYMSWKP